MVENTGLLNLKQHSDEYGSLVPVEGGKDIPFPIARVYYIFEVDENKRRGFHSHRELEQVLICVHGSVKILTKTPFQSETVVLDDPARALYIGPMVWREMYDFSDGAVLLVLASALFDPDEYIRDYASYEAMAKSFFSNKTYGDAFVGG